MTSIQHNCKLNQVLTKKETEWHVSKGDGLDRVVSEELTFELITEE